MKTIKANEMRGINRTAILELIRQNGVISRSEIARQLGVSMPTVLRIVDDLMSDNLVHELDKKEKSGGRRRTLIELNSHEHITLGLDLGGTKSYGAVVDLGGEILFDQTIASHESKGEDSYSLVVRMVSDLLNVAARTGKHILGLGIGVPGVTLHDKGIVEFAPSLEWRDFPLRDRIQEHFHLPVAIDNDVNLSAMGEMWFGVGREVKNLVLLNIGTGIGAAVVIDGVLYRGKHEMAGEIGYLIPGREFLSKEYRGFGALELLAAGTGISRRAEEMPASSVEGGRTLTAEDVFAACRRGDEWARGLIDQVVDYLAIAISAIVSLLDPDAVVLGGGVAQSADLLIDPIVTRLEGRIPHIPPIIPSMPMHRSAVLGAMINLLYNISDFYFVRKLA